MGFIEDISTATDMIRNADAVTLVSHIDADGIASEAIAAQAISRLGILVTPIFVRQLEPMTLKHVPNDNTLKVFTDLGAGQQGIMERSGFPSDNVLILDHHINQPAQGGTVYPQVNSQFYGSEYVKCSASGIAYLLAKKLDPINTDLAELAVVGNVGDMMARETCGLVGIAQRIANDGVESGCVSITKGLNFYGLSTRPLHFCLANSEDPFLPGISRDPKSAVDFLIRLGIYEKPSDHRVWEDLRTDEVKLLSSVVTEQMIANGESIERLFAELYFFPREIEKSPLRNASEYATMLNACGRWAKPKVGEAVCLGDRGRQYREAEHMLRHHRSIIRELCEYILNTGVVNAGSIQWIHVGGLYPDTIAGIGAGMVLSKLDTEKPIMVLCNVSDDPDLVKISMRTYEKVLTRGVDLQKALVEAAAEFNGVGGGHNIAAGAYISKGCENDFIRRVNDLIAHQLEAGSLHR